MSFAIGNTAVNAALIASTGTVTISLTAGSVLLIQVGTTALSGAGAPVTVTSVTSANLTFAVRSAQTRHDVNVGAGATWQDAEVWWANVPSNLTSEVVTVLLSGSPNTGTIGGYECKGVANPSSPWDPNVSLPDLATNDNTNPTVTGLSTTATAPVGLCFVFCSNAISVPAFSPGTWTAAHVLVQDLGGSTQNRTGLSWQQFASAQSSASWVAENSSVRNWLVTGDAFGQAPAATPILNKKPPRPRIKRGRWNVLDLRARRQLRRIFPPAPPSHIPFVKPPRPHIKRGRWNVAKRKRLQYLVPAARSLSANQQIPPFTQTATLLNNALQLTFSQQIPDFSQVATLLGSGHLAFDQQIPDFSQVATFAAESAAALARLPDNVMHGARGGPTFSTARLTGVSGLEQRIINFEQSVNSYTLGYGLNTATWPLVLALHYAQQGGAFGFGVKDQAELPIAGEVIGTGDGTTTNFQLIKVYATATRSYTRIITLPHASTLVVTVNGTPTSSYALLPGGIVSFTAAPANGAVIAASCDFDIEVAFAQSTDHLDIQLQLIAAGQIPAITLTEIPPTATGLAIMNVIAAPSGNVDPTHLPENVEKAARGGPTFSTTRLISTSGKPFLSANYPQSVNSYTIGYTASAATWPTIQAIFYAQLGGGFGFTFRDWSDYSASDQLIGVGDGLTKNFQLVRLYDDGPRRYGRYVTLPRAGTLALTVNGTPTSAYTLQAGGIVQFFVAPADGAVIAASFEFDLPVGFADDHLDITIQPGLAAPASVAQISALNLIEILPGSLGS